MSHRGCLLTSDNECFIIFVTELSSLEQVAQLPSVITQVVVSSFLSEMSWTICSIQFRFLHGWPFLSDFNGIDSLVVAKMQNIYINIYPMCTCKNQGQCCNRNFDFLQSPSTHENEQINISLVWKNLIPYNPITAWHKLFIFIHERNYALQLVCILAAAEAYVSHSVWVGWFRDYSYYVG